MKNTANSRIEQYVIDKVREIRKQKGISQRELSSMTEISIGFLGDVESTKSRAKFNLNHLNDIAKALGCSPKDFLPDDPL